jgi:hypothetical protein
MNWKNYFKPTAKRVLVFIALLIVTGYITYLISSTATEALLSFGFPLPFYTFGGITMTFTYQAPQFDVIYFLIDAIIWYVISCLIFKVKK